MLCELFGAKWTKFSELLLSCVLWVANACPCGEHVSVSTVYMKVQGWRGCRQREGGWLIKCCSVFLGYSLHLPHRSGCATVCSPHRKADCPLSFCQPSCTNWNIGINWMENHSNQTQIQFCVQTSRVKWVSEWNGARMRAWRGRKQSQQISASWQQTPKPVTTREKSKKKKILRLKWIKKKEDYIHKYAERKLIYKNGTLQSILLLLVLYGI